MAEFLAARTRLQGTRNDLNRDLREFESGFNGYKTRVAGQIQDYLQNVR